MDTVVDGVEKSVEILDRMIFIYGNNDLLEHQLPRTQQSQRRLTCLPRVTLLGRHDGEVVKTSLKWQEQINEITVLEF